MRTQIFWTAVIAGLSATVFLSGCGKTARVKSDYTIAKVAAAPKIDGVLDDPCWKALPALDMVSADGKKPAHSTSVRMTYDDRFLYVGFECEDPDAGSSVMEFDGAVTGEEHVALCIDAGNGMRGNFLIAAAPTGAFSDAYVLQGGNGIPAKVLREWNCTKLRVSVAMYGEGSRPGDRDRFWTVEMAVPLTEIITASRIPPQPGDVWRMNAYRLDLTGGREMSACWPDDGSAAFPPEKSGVVAFGE